MRSFPIVLLTFIAASKVAGEAASNIAYNFWLSGFSFGTAQFTVLAISAVVFFFIYVPLTFVLCVVYHQRRPQFRFSKLICGPGSFQLLFLVGFMDCFIDFSSAYASPMTPIVTQAFAKSAEPMLTWILERIFLANKTPVGSWPLWGSFFFVAVAVVLHLWDSLHNKHHAFKLGYFILYILSVAASSVYNIVQGKYMRLHNSLPEREEEYPLHSRGGISDPSETVESQRPPAYLVRLINLSGDMVTNLLLTFAVGSLIDAIPNFGSSHSISDAWDNLRLGLQCMIHCSQAIRWYALICFGGWAIAYVADTALNQLSPAMSSVIAMGGGPLQVLVLMIHPVWSLGSQPPQTNEQWILSIGALCSAVVAAVLYATHQKAYATLAVR